jgi:hypothetical protein
MPKVIGLAEIEKIFAITDAMKISREALVIPLRCEAGGRLSVMKDTKLEIVADRDADFDSWLSRLEPQIRALKNRQPD